MKVKQKNIEMEDLATVDGRDVSEDGKKLDKSTYARTPNTLVERDEHCFSDLTAARAAILHTPRKIEFTGGIIGEFIFDGGSDVIVPINVQSTGAYSHNHNDLYYTRAEIDNIASQITPTFSNHDHAVLRNGDGLAFFNYNGTTNITVNTAFAGISGDFGVETRYVSRSDHLHNKIYYTKDEIDDTPPLKIFSDGNYIQLISKTGKIISQVEVVTSLSLSPSPGLPGLPLMSTENNNEPNKVVRTDSNGYIRAKGVIITAPETTTSPKYVWVDDGTGKLVRVTLQSLMSNSGISGYDVTQHYHTELRTKTNPTGTWIFTQQETQWSAACWRIRSNGGDNVSVFHATNANFATRANYADLAENYFVKGNLSIGTLVQVSTDKNYELEEYSNFPYPPIGVISEKPGFILNAQDEGKENVQPVALNGKTKIRIIGKIEKGDPITPSLNFGVAEATDTPNVRIFGYALESNDREEEKLVMCVVGV